MMKFWKWFVDRIREDLSFNLKDPIVEYVFGGVAVMLGLFYFYELLIGWSWFVVFKSISIIALGSMVMIHGWYRKFVVG